MNTRLSNKTAKTAKTENKPSANGAKGTTKIINADFIQRELKSVPRERMTVVFSEVKLHADATLRGDRDEKTGAVASEVNKIYTDLDDGKVTVETLINHPSGKMTVAILTDKENMVVWHDGHTRSCSIRRYKGETFSAEVDAIRITETELRLFAPQVNSSHGVNYTMKEIKAAILKLLKEDPRFPHYSDESIVEFFGGGEFARNVANWRRGLVITSALDLVKNKKYELRGSILAMTNKYMPAKRYGIDGVEKNISNQQKTLLDNLYADDAFQGLRPEDKEAAKAEPAKAASEPAKAAKPTADQPATSEPTATDAPTTDQPTADQPATSEPTATDAPTTDQPATSEPGTLYAFDGVEFTVKSGKVAIVANGLIDIAAILAFADAYRMDQQSAELFDVEVVNVA